MSKFSWTPALVDELTDLRDRDEPMSFATIARLWRARGLEVTKSGLIGKARRIGLLERGQERTATPTTPKRLDALDSFSQAGHCVFPNGE